MILVVIDFNERWRQSLRAKIEPHFAPPIFQNLKQIYSVLQIQVVLGCTQLRQMMLKSKFLISCLCFFYKCKILESTSLQKNLNQSV